MCLEISASFKMYVLMFGTNGHAKFLMFGAKSSD